MRWSDVGRSFQARGPAYEKARITHVENARRTYIVLRVAFGCLVWPIACRVQKRTQHKVEHFDKHY